MKKIMLSLMAVLGMAVMAPAKNLVNLTSAGVALQGYDPVAYFTETKPVKGNAKHQAQFNGAIYHFASAAHHALFEANPEKYEPQYGGYCGYAASINRLSPINVNFWQVLDGRLVLQHNQKALDHWNKDVPGNIKKADKNWPRLVDRNGSDTRPLVNVDGAGVALEGHDPVGYFTEHRPVKGDPKHEANFGGARYFFASAENRETFERDPAKYAPVFGGYCGYAASINKISPVNIHIFQISPDGRLVLQHTPKAYSLFNADLAGGIERADRNWPGLTARNAAKQQGASLWKKLFGWIG